MATLPATNRILVVEDDPSIRKLVTSHFRRCGFEVEYAIAAEEVASDERYDVVLTDVHLPGQSGIDLARRIHAAWPEQAVVFMTGDADPMVARAALADGTSGYLLKPFELFELDAAVNMAVTRTRAVRKAAPVVTRNRIAGSMTLPYVHVTRRPRVLVSPPAQPQRDRATTLKVRLRLAAAVTGMLALAWLVGAVI
jgi:DNA-binding response OmpR family regulator